jgi:hypothetical protein
MSTASGTSAKDGEVLTLEEVRAQITRKRKAMGKVWVPKNKGNRRTPSKRALLAALER